MIQGRLLIDAFKKERKAAVPATRVVRDKRRKLRDKQDRREMRDGS